MRGRALMHYTLGFLAGVGGPCFNTGVVRETTFIPFFIAVM